MQHCMFGDGCAAWKRQSGSARKLCGFRQHGLQRRSLHQSATLESAPITYINCKNRRHHVHESTPSRPMRRERIGGVACSLFVHRIHRTGGGVWRGGSRADTCARACASVGRGRAGSRSGAGRGCVCRYCKVTYKVGHPRPVLPSLSLRTPIHPHPDRREQYRPLNLKKITGIKKAGIVRACTVSYYVNVGYTAFPIIKVTAMAQKAKHIS